MKKLSIIIPVYNEEKTIYDVLKLTSEVALIHPIEKEIIVVNDSSTDHSLDEINRFSHDFPDVVRLVNHPINKGKRGSHSNGNHLHYRRLRHHSGRGPGTGSE